MKAIGNLACKNVDVARTDHLPTQIARADNALSFLTLTLTVSRVANGYANSTSFKLSAA